MSEEIKKLESHIDKYGQIAREEIPEKEEDKNFRLINLREVVLVQSIRPDFAKKSDDVLYWRPGRLEQNKRVFEEIKTIANQLNVSEAIDSATEEKVVLKDLFSLIEKSILYSESINQRLAEESIKVDAEQLADARKKLMEGK